MNVIDRASALIACPSITPTNAGVMEALQTQLEALGFTVWREIFTEEGYEATENLYARLGSASPNLCFAGHVDVVPPGDWSRWSHPPFEPIVKDGVLYGRGAEDMKGAIAAFISGVEHYLARHSLANGSLSLLITGDEEGVAVNGTQKMLSWLATKGEVIDACIVGEPTNPTFLGEMVKVGRRGSLSATLSVAGKQGHVAYPHLADNPVSKLLQTLHEMQNYLLDSGTEFFPPSNLQVTSVDVGNETVNLIPASASARLNIRFNDTHTGASLEAWLRDVCNRWCGDAYTLDCRVSGEAFLTRDEALINALSQAVKDVTGHMPQLSTTGGTSDARFIKNVCPVIEFGTTGATAHQIDERVAIATLEQLAQVYARFIEIYLA